LRGIYIRDGELLSINGYIQLSNKLGYALYIYLPEEKENDEPSAFPMPFFSGIFIVETFDRNIIIMYLDLHSHDGSASRAGRERIVFERVEE